MSRFYVGLRQFKHALGRIQEVVFFDCLFDCLYRLHQFFCISGMFSRQFGDVSSQSCKINSTVVSKSQSCKINSTVVVVEFKTVLKYLESV